MIKVLWTGIRLVCPSAPVVEAAAALHREPPGVKPVVLTAFGRPGHLRGAMEAGADAFLVEEAPVAQIAAAVRTVPAGERVIDPMLAALGPRRRRPPPHRPRTRDPARRRRRLHPRGTGPLPAPLPGRGPQPPLHRHPGTGRPNRTEAARVAREKGRL
ncbi:hypothetical protein GCM10027073_55380 [Streptomyces chlorus]